MEGYVKYTGGSMLKKNWRLRLNSDFNRIFSVKRSSASKFAVVYVHTGERKYGFIASKKVGNAVERNRAKRLMREIVRRNWDHLDPKQEIILIARPSIKGISYVEVEKAILGVFRRVGVWKI